MPYPQKGECRNTGRTRFKKGYPKPKNAYKFPKGHKVFGGFQKGKEHWNWKGGKIYDEGYILIKKPNHPFCQKNGYVYEHRLIIEKHLNRYLKIEEVVHHINSIRDDNRIENLKLFSNHSKHLKHSFQNLSHLRHQK